MLTAALQGLGSRPDAELRALVKGGADGAEDARQVLRARHAHPSPPPGFRYVVRVDADGIGTAILAPVDPSYKPPHRDYEAALKWTMAHFHLPQLDAKVRYAGPLSAGGPPWEGIVRSLHPLCEGESSPAVSVHVSARPPSWPFSGAVFCPALHDLILLLADGREKPQTHASIWRSA